MDEKLIKWNDIFEELLIDANALIRELLESINYIAIFGVFMVFLGAFAFTMLRELATYYTIVSLGIFTAWILFGIILIWKWYGLRSKYNRFRSMRKEMESN